jgi:hypothetical protein
MRKLVFLYLFVTFFSSNLYASENEIMLILDSSGSMLENGVTGIKKIEEAKKITSNVINRIPIQDYHISLISFGDNRPKDCTDLTLLVGPKSKTKGVKSALDPFTFWFRVCHG